MRIDDLKLMFAMAKRKKVYPIKFMMNPWLEVFTLVGDVECTSLVTRIATNIGLMQRSFLSLITEHPYIDFEYFRQAHMLKRKDNGSLVMIYRGYTNKVSLPNRNIGLYAVQSLTMNLQKNEAAPHRSASARITRTSHPQVYATDPTPEELAYASYTGFEGGALPHVPT
jgi:hypothetical protein